MDFTGMTLPERANYCLNLYLEEGTAIPKCADHFNNNKTCGYICCGHCPSYTGCDLAKCKQVWIDPKLVIDNPAGRLIYVVLGDGRLVSGSVPCTISEMYDDNN
ncbi:hypothetical protein Psfp_03713 [Pelotomaculum sp. FP]|uniref:hypothetical protein n=1 Tax=Pelotomaculum sp. FP TaxID=261474 RepID=UPI00106664E9|nr:hypothetical protein [Pelotomaculum sp. FP]TEB12635.1 hypothetical protein Psfp_03713 [Pelotomaculum sp. FP]